MIDKVQIKSFLRINGIEAIEADDVVKEALVKAKWSDKEITEALMILRADGEDTSTRSPNVNSVFHTEKSLSPAAIHSLLGFEVKIDTLQNRGKRANNYNAPISSYLTIFVLSILMSGALLMYFMYTEKAGIFHQAFSSIL